MTATILHEALPFTCELRSVLFGRSRWSGCEESTFQNRAVRQEVSNGVHPNTGLFDGIDR